MAINYGRTYSFDNHDEEDLGYDRQRQGHSSDYYPRDISQDTQRSTPYDPHPQYYDDAPPPPPQHRSYPSLPPNIGSSRSGHHQPPGYSREGDPTKGPDGNNDRYADRSLDHTMSQRTASTATPGADNLGEAAAGGGISGIALGVASTNERESGLEAVRGMPRERSYETTDTPYIPAPPPGSRHRDPFSTPTPSHRTDPFDDGRVTPSPGQITPTRLHSSQQSIPMINYNRQDSTYSDNPYKRVSTAWDTRIAHGDIDPDRIEDDGDDSIAPPVARKRSMMGFNRAQPDHSGSVAAPAAAGAAAGGVLGTLGSLVGRGNPAGNGGRDPSGQYASVNHQTPEYGEPEKSDWLSKQKSGNKRLRWIVGIIVTVLLLAAIAGGVIGGIKGAQHNKDKGGNSSDGSGHSASEDDGKGDLTKDSSEIQKLLNNPNLHKVFPGMDYTPYNAQYPACLSNPTSQNNVTRDMAVLSQMTNAVRLYGTDCNQTEMVLHAIDVLGLTDMKVWLGVWLADNSTTNTRGLSAMYDILGRHGADHFAGVIVGNEVLYRKDMTATQLGDTLSEVKKNFTSLKYDLPVATSDLGDDWTAGLTADVDIVMSNIHPFFAGVTAEEGAGWTWDFWQQHDVILTKGTSVKNVISEVGWPSDGGNDCGQATTCAKGDGAVAGVDEMNKFMDTFICQSLANGTEFFW